MSLFVLGEFEMALSWSEKFGRKTKTEAKHYKCIIEDPELHNACNENCQKQYRNVLSTLYKEQRNFCG